MRTEASARYEKGLDPMNTMKAVQRACELVELLGAGEVVDGVMDVIARDSNPRSPWNWSRRRSMPCWAPTFPNPRCAGFSSP